MEIKKLYHAEVKDWNIYPSYEAILEDLDDDLTIGDAEKLSIATCRQSADAAEAGRRLAQFFVKRETSVDLSGLHCCLTGIIQITKNSRMIHNTSLPIVSIELLPYLVDVSESVSENLPRSHTFGYLVTTVSKKTYYITTLDMTRDFITFLSDAAEALYGPIDLSAESASSLEAAATPPLKPEKSAEKIS